MAKRLHMTNADYVAIAISPALIMLLVGSIVFFLIEIMYVGQYELRLNYVFSLFVFSTVLIGRISIEMGASRATLYSIPLAIATFLFLQKFVEHPSPFSPLINLILIAVVWWCAHKLTWDCTLIDDNEDSSGEGLIERLGLDHSPETNETQSTKVNKSIQGEPTKTSWWIRIISGESGPHTPGLWVLYFSLAALPIFGLGQRFIDPGNTASRRYAFVLLFVYMMAGLSLLVTTSFLGLRRYLRQRNLEMPAPMAVTWLIVGGVLIACVMFFAILLPRPSAEYAISEPPWKIDSPLGLSSSKYGRGPEGAEGEDASQAVESEDETAPEGSTTKDGSEGSSSGESQKSNQRGSSKEEASKSSDDGSNTETTDSEKNSDSNNKPGSKDNETNPNNDPSNEDNSPSKKSNNENADPRDSNEQSQPNDGKQSNSDSTSSNRSETDQQELESSNPSKQSRQTTPPRSSTPRTLNASGFFNLLRILFFLAIAVLLLYMAYKYRRELIKGFQDLIRDIQEWFARLFGRKETNSKEEDDQKKSKRTTYRRRFREFNNPFQSDWESRYSAAELVIYTFDAFEAWSSDRGVPRTLDQTPQEFVRSATSTQEEIHRPTQQLAMLYSQLAYGDGNIPPQAIEKLKEVWHQMDKNASMVNLDSVTAS